MALRKQVSTTQSGEGQLDLFSMLHLPMKQQSDYSNTVEIYDALPKYVWTKTRAQSDLKNATITRPCTIRGKAMTVKLKPALIEKDGENVLIYPGQREELVEDALRKLAVNGNGVYVQGKAGVNFTLYELKKELERVGHTFDLNEIKEALLVCRGAVLECLSADGKALINSNLFGLLGLTTRKDVEEKGRDAKCYVQFNPLVNESILNLTFRQYNYKIGMDIRSPLSRFIYKRMAQYWIQASERHPYTPNLTTFLAQSPRGLSEKMGENLRAMRNALDVLIKHDVIERYDEEKVLQGKQKCIDANYIIYPHPQFVKEIIKANNTSKAIKRLNVDDNLVIGEFKDI